MMEKPKAPARREGLDIDTDCVRGLFRATDFTNDEFYLIETSDAEMLIHALAEWIEYKRQLELWESAERDREHVL